MRQCLTSPEGYYASQTGNQDPFGRTGDFVTSPEISQVFGELVGIWFVSQWIVQGRKNSGIDLIEVGPGRGTLMDDILRVSLLPQRTCCTCLTRLGSPKFLWPL